MEDIRRERELDRELHTEDLAGTAPARPGSTGKPAVGYEEPAAGAAHAALFSTEETESFRSEWSAIQIGFVDEPRQSVERADALVARLMKRLAEVFAGERSELEHQWDRGDRISTEDLRVALTKYRSFFDRLLSF
jgi:hypothetical protein